MPTIQRYLYKLILAVIRFLLLTLFTLYLQEVRQEQPPAPHIRRDEIDNQNILHPSDEDTDADDIPDSGIE